MNYSGNNNVNIDFERTMMYTRKRPDELNYQKNDNNNVKKPLPIKFKSEKNDTPQIDSKFTINPITGQNSASKISDYNYPMNSYQNKKECRSEMDNRMSGYQNLPQTQAIPLFNKTNTNNTNNTNNTISSINSELFSHIPLNTRLSNSSDIYSHTN
jgi:hypothetical protein